MYIINCDFYSKPNTTINDIPVLSNLWLVLAELPCFSGKETLYPEVGNTCLDEMEGAAHLSSKTCVLVYSLGALS